MTRGFDEIAAARAVFLSYASEDAAPAQRICDGLRAAGIEVWFDRSELRGGDAWDSAIRRQIKNCALFVPVISANSQTRAEGYFRLEWKLAVDRSHLMAADRAFIVPVVVDNTSDSTDRVPDPFRAVQWTRLPDGETSPAFAERISRLLAAVPLSAMTTASNAATVAPVAAPTSLHVTSSASAPAPAAVSHQPSVDAPSKRWGNATRITLACLTIAALALIAIWSVRYFQPSPTAVVPYSVEDKRMAFALLPFQAPAGDSHGAQVAAATGTSFAHELESDSIKLHLVSGRGVEEAMLKYTAPRDLAKALGVHFLIRGHLSKTSQGYTLDASLIDGDSERVLKNTSTLIAQDALIPRYVNDVDDATNDMVWEGLQHEVKRAANKSLDQMDVRDLAFRAYVIWSNGHNGGKEESKQGYDHASELLERANALAPDDFVATHITAEINLCDCEMAWSTDIEQQKRIGSAALEKILRIEPSDAEMRFEKAALYDLRGRTDEALIIVNTFLEQDPDDAYAMSFKAHLLLKQGHAREALPLVDELQRRYPTRFLRAKALAGAVHYAVGDYEAAARLTRNAAAQMRESWLRNPVDSPVRWTLAASEVHLGHMDQAKAALTDFYAAVPSVHTITDMKQWMSPTADLSNSDTLFADLALAGAPN